MDPGRSARVARLIQRRLEQAETPVMKSTKARDDRGASLVEYALIVMVIAMAGFGAVGAVGKATASGFDEATVGLAAGGVGVELTPKEKWAQAQEDYAQAIAAAKATKAAEVAAAKAEYDAAKKANNALPKADRPAANAAAKDTYDAATAAANATYSSSVQSAKDTQAAAKKEYNANK